MLIRNRSINNECYGFATVFLFLGLLGAVTACDSAQTTSTTSVGGGAPATNNIGTGGEVRTTTGAGGTGTGGNAVNLGGTAVTTTTSTGGTIGVASTGGSAGTVQTGIGGAGTLGSGGSTVSTTNGSGGTGIGGFSGSTAIAQGGRTSTTSQPSGGIAGTTTSASMGGTNAGTSGLLTGTQALVTTYAVPYCTRVAQCCQQGGFSVPTSASCVNRELGFYGESVADGTALVNSAGVAALLSAIQNTCDQPSYVLYAQLTLGTRLPGAECTNVSQCAGDNMMCQIPPSASVGKCVTLGRGKLGDPCAVTCDNTSTCRWTVHVRRIMARWPAGTRRACVAAVLASALHSVASGKPANRRTAESMPIAPAVSAVHAAK